MRKKLRDASGLTLVELLCGIVILVLLGLLVNAGIGVAAKSYRELTAAAETQLLLSTAADALASELRFAQEVTAEAGRLTSYRSPSFGAHTTLELKEGRILAGGRHLLPPGWQSGTAMRAEPTGARPTRSVSWISSGMRRTAHFISA